MSAEGSTETRSQRMPRVPLACIFGPERLVRAPPFAEPAAADARVYVRLFPILEAARHDVFRVPEARARFKKAARLAHVAAVRDLTTDADCRGMLIAYEVFRAFLNDYTHERKRRKTS